MAWPQVDCFDPIVKVSIIDENPRSIRIRDRCHLYFVVHLGDRATQFHHHLRG